MTTDAIDRTARIRDLNDDFRRTFSGGKVLMTCGVAELPDMVKAAALQKAATFDEIEFAAKLPSYIVAAIVHVTSPAAAPTPLAASTENGIG